jgi:hypothetical protein
MMVDVHKHEKESFEDSLRLQHRFLRMHAQVGLQNDITANWATASEQSPSQHSTYKELNSRHLQCYFKRFLQAARGQSMPFDLTRGIPPD